VITYIDTSVLMKVFIDEAGTAESEQIWLRASALVCAEIGYVEIRAALSAARRASRIEQSAYEAAKFELEELWAQVEIVAISEAIIRSAGDLAESSRLRGYDAVHLAAAVEVRATVMASADKALCEAAAALGLHVANPVGIASE
jgi:uncharacterized protein